MSGDPGAPPRMAVPLPLKTALTTRRKRALEELTQENEPKKKVETEALMQQVEPESGHERINLAGNLETRRGKQYRERLIRRSGLRSATASTSEKLQQQL